MEKRENHWIDENFGKNAVAYFPFNIKNTNPIITSEIDLSPEEIFRTEECLVSVNVTDIETTVNELTITVEVQDSEGQDVIEKILGHRSDNLFTIGFSIPSDRPIGTYSITVTATDKNNGIDSKVAYLDVKNNFPEIKDYIKDDEILVNNEDDLIMLVSAIIKSETTIKLIRRLIAISHDY